MENSYVKKNEGFITFHKWKDFHKLPMLYRLRFVDKALPPLVNDALVFGTAFDDYLHGEFEGNYIPVSTRGVKAKSLIKKRESILAAIDKAIKKSSEAFEKHKAKKEELEGLTTKAAAKSLESASNKSAEAKANLEAITNDAKKDIPELEKEMLAYMKVTEITETMSERIVACNAELDRQPLYHRLPKCRVTWEYRGQKIRGELDGLSFDKTDLDGVTYEGLIVDDKTSASWQSLSHWLPQYKQQLAWYNWGLRSAEKTEVLKKGKWTEIKFKKIKSLPGQLNVVTKEFPPRSYFLMSEPDDLETCFVDEIQPNLDEMIETMKIGIYPMADRHEWTACDGYGYSDYDLQINLMKL